MSFPVCLKSIKRNHSIASVLGQWLLKHGVPTAEGLFQGGEMVQKVDNGRYTFKTKGNKIGLIIETHPKEKIGQAHLFNSIVNFSPALALLASISSQVHFLGFMRHKLVVNNYIRIEIERIMPQRQEGMILSCITL